LFTEITVASICHFIIVENIINNNYNSIFLLNIIGLFVVCVCFKYRYKLE